MIVGFAMGAIAFTGYEAHDVSSHRGNPGPLSADGEVTSPQPSPKDPK